MSSVPRWNGDRISARRYLDHWRIQSTPRIYNPHLAYTIHTSRIQSTPHIYNPHLAYTIQTSRIQSTPLVYNPHLTYTIHTSHIQSTYRIYNPHLAYPLCWRSWRRQQFRKTRRQPFPLATPKLSEQWSDSLISSNLHNPLKADVCRCRQRPATTNVSKPRSRNYSLEAPDDEQ
jgi:hypothetical protein